ncbi:hypothetical protein JN531_003720 [Flagellatimonas centrodinii]|uniref:hypothetical protein n=1 Tax=Flagellatimonas centrodinii TaxID=2806210 RepID=UPI001FEFE843|nr:hypothetical protein [Flagellatimonas centrodinii]ULQ47395.1 hypothetical protein JN531_003720 [Flagellatimonas centrodinii]
MQIFRNNFSTTLSSPAADDAVQIVIPTVDADKLPADFNNHFIMLTLQAGSTMEIIRVTGRTGDTLDVIRAQEGTAAAAWSAGDKVENRMTAGAVDMLAQQAITMRLGADDSSTVSGLGPVTRRAPFGMTLSGSGVRASLVTAQSSGTEITIDLKVNGSSILSEPIHIENGAKTSLTAATQPVLSGNVIPDDAEITAEVLTSDDAGAAGLRVTLIGAVNPYAEIPPPPPLFGDAYLAWEFEEEFSSDPAADASGNGRVGTYNSGGGSINLEQAGPTSGGNAVQFTGDGTGVNCAITGISLASGEGDGVMMELFVRRDGFPSEDPWPVAFMDDGNGVAGNNYVSVRVSSGMQVLDGVEFDPLEASSSESSANLTYELWHIWVQRATTTPEFDFGSLQVFRQGNLVADQLLNADHPPTTFTRFMAGVGEVSGSLFGHPLIAHAALYGFKLSDAQMEARCAAFGVAYLG